MDEHMRSMLHHRELENLKGRYGTFLFHKLVDVGESEGLLVYFIVMLQK